MYGLTKKPVGKTTGLIHNFPFFLYTLIPDQSRYTVPGGASPEIFRPDPKQKNGSPVFPESGSTTEKWVF